MSLLHDSSESTDDSPDGTATRRFRAATIEAALADARAELGQQVEIVDANRIRRGGVGGFFATDLGVELVVRTSDRRDAATPFEPEYLDDAATPFEPEYLAADVARSIETLPRSGKRRPADVATPHFYDRIVEEPVEEPVRQPVAGVPHADALRVELPMAAAMVEDRGAGSLTTAGIDRLIASVTAAEQAAHDRGAAVPASFADHLARHLAGGAPVLGERVLRSTTARPDRRDEPERSTAGPEPGRSDAAFGDRRLAAVPAPREPAGPIEAPAPDDATGARDTPPEPDTVHAADASSTAGPDRSVDGTDAPDRRSRGAAAPKRARNAGARDATRRRIDLAAGAVGRLVEQLSDVQPVEGSRMRDLTRLVVKVTDPDGTVIEIAAELDGAHHG